MSPTEREREAPRFRDPWLGRAGAAGADDETPAATSVDVASPDARGDAAGLPLSPADSERPAWPLRVGPTGRYLVDQEHRPVFLHGDSAWSLLAATTLPEADRYLRDRARRGFNSIIVNLIERTFAPDPPRNRAGDEPFTIPGDFSTPNEAYFTFADRVLQRAADEGLLVLLAPCYLGHRVGGFPGFGGRPEGWFAEVLENGVDKCRAFGRFVGHRYRQAGNILWVMAGDRCPGPALEHVRAMAEGIREGDGGRHLMTAHVNPECKPLDTFPDDPWLSVNQTYSYSIVHRALIEDYRHVPVRPNVLFESTYENEHNASDVQVRRQAYWALLSGACGQFMGNFPLWLFPPGWESALDSLAARGMTDLRRLIASCRWWELEPDVDHEIVVGGLGELNGLDYCAAARTLDGRLALAYMPTARTIQVDLARLRGPAIAASWFDPAGSSSAGSSSAGSSSAGSGPVGSGPVGSGPAGVHPAGIHPPDGVRPFTPPEPHDWVLVLRSQEERDPAS